MVRYSIADDAPFIHEVIKNLLTEDEFKFVGSAFNGNEAIELVKKILPDVLFLDFVMPFKNGIEVAAEAKIIWPELKIIGMSTIDDEKIIINAKKNGVDEFVEKPFTKLSLFKALEKVVGTTTNLGKENK
ncbi:MAG: response regulator [Deltaproteobacteria bacterium]|jgi:two-component system chemotaxis response regulator CheY|nr:response regulator [Deltaproteobacteria bacterium]